MNRFAALVMCLGLALAACGNGSGAPEVSDARIGEPSGPNAAMYFSASSDEPDRLIGASTDVAASVQIHETVMNSDGTMGMSAVEGLDVSSGSPLVLEPGGFHLMLIDVDRLDVGDTVDVTLQWRDAGDMVVEAEVVGASDASG